MIITSVSNPKIKELLSLKDKKARKAQGVFLAEGINLVKDIPCDAVIRTYIIGEHVNPNFSLREGAEILRVSDTVLKKLSDVEAPQGIFAVVEIKAGRIDPNFDAIVLDRVRDPGNVGTILRSAAAFGFFNAVLIDCADVYSPKVVRSSMGGGFRLNLIEAEEKQVRELLPVNNYEIFSLDMRGTDILKADFSKTKRHALIVGNEADGVSPSLSSIGKTLSIKMENGVESLNAAAAAAIAMFVAHGNVTLHPLLSI
ncbi:MAG: RNA methyltransferase [Clostridiales bacterium]|jgi:TrmH family RNA methyltransferase|nr:RNA methyltransferase [Clostridiales bacterium]